ncbi:MAG: hypothetical protein CL931_04130 [Deltaproteobacteria bacterium]|nr:hypothetical protein [Deltaproteobacteria bacterium]
MYARQPSRFCSGLISFRYCMSPAPKGAICGKMISPATPSSSSSFMRTFASHSPGRGAKGFDGSESMSRRSASVGA